MAVLSAGLQVQKIEHPFTDYRSTESDLAIGSTPPAPTNQKKAVESKEAAQLPYSPKNPAQDAPEQANRNIPFKPLQKSTKRRDAESSKYHSLPEELVNAVLAWRRAVQQPRHAAGEDGIRKANEKIEELCPYATSESELQRSLTQYNFRLEQFRGANLVHGSTSASLLAFSDYNDRSGQLLPLGVMEKQGKIPFSGEITMGRSGVNQRSLSTAPLAAFDLGLRYTEKSQKTPLTSSTWMLNLKKEETTLIRWVTEFCADLNGDLPEIAHELKEAFKNGIQSPDKDLTVFKDLMDKYGSGNERSYKFFSVKCRYAFLLDASINDFEVAHQRLVEWPKLNAEEQKLVEQSFSVLYGIRTGRADDFIAVRSVPGEIGLGKGATPEEIAVIFVPKLQLEAVEHFLTKNGHSHIHVDALPEY